MIAQVQDLALLGDGVVIGSIEDGMGTEPLHCNFSGWRGHRTQAAKLILY